MLVRLVCGLALVVVLIPSDGHADCAQEISGLMSRDTEKLTSRYNRISKRIERQGPNARLQAESCRIAKQLEPLLRQQIAALKQSRCSKNPEVSAMVADIVRAHEDDLAMMRKGGSADCR